jgi:YVTN family beta-propeller protein
MFVRRICLGTLGAWMLCAISADAAPFAYVVNQLDDTVSVVDSATNVVTATIPVGLFPGGIAITPDGIFAYVTNSGSNTISVIATATNTVVATLPAGPAPVGLAVTPNGKFVYVVNSSSNTVFVVATATNTTVASITVGSNPRNIAITPNGAFAYVTNFTSNTVSVIAMATNTVVSTIPFASGAGPAGIAITPNGDFAYVGIYSDQGGAAVIATATNTVVASIGRPFYFDELGEVAIGPHGAYAYLTVGSSELQVVATATNTVLGNIELPTGGRGLALTPDGAFVYVTLGTNQISVISTASFTVVATITVGNGAAAVAFAPSPAVISASPSPATGLSNTFALTYSDVYGASDLNAVGVMFISTVSGSNSCTVLYSPASNLLYLLNDAGTGSSSITPGSGTLSNTQCTINGSGTSIVTAGNVVTLNLAVTASSTFTGKHNIYLFANNNSSINTNWVNKGTWTPATNSPPAVVSVTPSSASGFSNTFALAYSDLNGVSDLSVVAVIFNSAASSLNSCEVLYAPGTNLLYLLNDAGTGSSSITPGSGTLSNSQCIIAGSGTSVVRSGTILTLKLDVTASSIYASTQNIFMFASDNSAANTGWIDEGTWTP